VSHTPDAGEISSGLIPRTVTEEIFSRPPTLKFFISSQMRSGVLMDQRRRAAGIVEGTSIAHAWYWERDAAAGPYCAEDLCVGHASGSDGLILILGSRLTEMTEKEFRAAKHNGVPCFMFINGRVRQDPQARAFIDEQRADVVVTANFRNRSELESHIIRAIRDFAARAWRLDYLNRLVRHADAREQT
jgi:hypothetical protein